MTSDGHPSNEFRNYGRIANQVGQQTVQGDVHIHQNPSDDPSHLLTLLPTAPQAAFNAYDSRHDPTCLPGTRADLLKQIEAWADGSDDRHIFWLNGWAGTGKSTIARTVARRYHEQDCLGASFFFSRDQEDRRHAGKVFTSIATQLAEQSAVLKEHICEVLARHRNIASNSLRDQWTRLILRPLSKLEARTTQTLTIVIDALDECENEDDVRGIIQLFAEAKVLGKGRLRLFLTSRQETPIRLGFDEIPDNQHHDFVLHSISSSVVEQDLLTFFRHELKSVDVSKQWPSEADVARLVERAGGLFIWAATACRFIKSGRRLAWRRLASILDGDSVMKGSEKKLDEIYMTILIQSISGDYDDQDREELLELFREIVGSIAILFDPLPTAALARLLNKPKEEVDQTLDDLYSVLEVPQDRARPIRVVHPSFHDFLLNKERCTNMQLWVDECKIHYHLFVSCIDLMSITLKQDICELGRPGARTVEVNEKWMDKHLPRELRYACRYWVEHLRRSRVDVARDGRVEAFLREHLLHWLEALGLMQAASEGVRMMTILQSLVTPDGNPELHPLIYDARRFVLYNRWIIDEAPLQTYCSALVFAPQRSLTRRLFRREMAGWMRVPPKTSENWSSLLQTLEGHTDGIHALVFSPNGQLLASASDDHTVRLWDAATGALRGSLKGHTDQVNAVTFSPNGQLLASASWDGTVRLWDAATGALRDSLEGHTGVVNAVIFFPDGQLLASASCDHTIRLWDTATGAWRGSLKGHTDTVSKVTFSPNGQLLASASWDGTARLWDAATGALRDSLEGHTGVVAVVTFSPDGQLLASVSEDPTVRLWDAATGVLRGSLKGHTDQVNAVIFSPDGQLLASASRDHTIRLWDTATGAWRGSLKGHTDTVSKVTFSPNGQLLASASRDHTIRLWDTATGAWRGSLEGHTTVVNVVIFSPNGQLLASASWDHTVRLWDAATGALWGSLESHTDRVSKVIFSPNGQLLASASYDKTVRLWDAATGALRGSLEGHTDQVNAVIFSPDGQLLASASRDHTIRLWDAATGVLRGSLEGHTRGVSAVTFSPNGQLLASASLDSTVQLWDMATEAWWGSLKGHTSVVEAVTFSPDGQLLASASWDGTVRLWDTATGALRDSLEGHTDQVNAVTFSPNGQLLASTSWDETVRLWDIKMGKALYEIPADGHIYELSFSANGSYLITDKGLINIGHFFLSAGQSHLESPPCLMVRNDWVARELQDILWLPSEYRATCAAARENRFVMGHASGQVSLIEIDIGHTAFNDRL